ncbi:MAG: hypothetical protein KDC10_03430 [Calditrichaeota bacterium]|nr:hypothetical protein [Candidatus Cloacimonadota bacterium]MCA9785002.1 hypothetical protein [Candidatus Cloacimonadota bacterium]MCB1046230.1 hypothetical protein [Calditrichota bacterium]MCB9474223.1 hypothetical protein [Candidatus Delongbacteria bacterium]
MENQSPDTLPETHLDWTWHPLARKPVQGVLVVLMILVISGLVLYWLGASAVSAALIVIFIFSLRDYLFPASCRVDEHALVLSSPLTGTRQVGWDQVRSRFQGPRQMKLTLTDGRRVLLPPLPDPDLRAALNTLIERKLARDASND